MAAPQEVLPGLGNFPTQDGTPITDDGGEAIQQPRHRREAALRVRVNAAREAYARPHPPQTPNSDETLPQAIGRFTKGLPHTNNGLVQEQAFYDAFAAAIRSGNFVAFRILPFGPPTRFFSTILAAQPICSGEVGLRKWESPTAGHSFDLEGSDAQALASPPAPTFCSDELAAEMAELYVMALLRDFNWDTIDDARLARELLEALSKMPWFNGSVLPGLSTAERLRRRTIRIGGAPGQGIITKPSDIFRGIAPGDEQGPVVSQFLISFLPPRGFDPPLQSLDPNERTGDPRVRDLPNPGIRYGAIRIDPRIQVVPPAPSDKHAALNGMGDYMTNWPAYLDVQNGAAFARFQQFVQPPQYRFALTPRCLSNYVHYDQLYEAYLNAAIYLLEVEWAFDPGLPLNNEPTQAGFAHFGGPHILTLVTEVATRALKAVRYQKFQVHRRLRPEAVGGLMELIDQQDKCNVPSEVAAAIRPLYRAIPDVIKARVREHNERVNRANAEAHQYGHEYPIDTDGVPYRDNTLLLPMAFAEGSPMHPAYGAGHATVAGACVTVLKAWFDHSKTFDGSSFFRKVYQTNSADGGATLREIPQCRPALTLEGELNKLAANISNARNISGVHYFSDYHSSMLLGEEIAIQLLREQKLTYPEQFTMTVPRFFSQENVII